MCLSLRLALSLSRTWKESFFKKLRQITFDTLFLKKFISATVITVLNLPLACFKAENDFRLDLTGTNAGTLYGKGIYLAENVSKSAPQSHHEGHERFANKRYMKYLKMNWNLYMNLSSKKNPSQVCWDRTWIRRWPNMIQIWYDTAWKPCFPTFQRVNVTQVWWIWRRSSWSKGRRTGGPTTSGSCGSTSCATIRAIGLQIASWKGAVFFLQISCCFKKRN